MTNLYDQYDQFSVKGVSENTQKRKKRNKERKETRVREINRTTVLPMLIWDSLKKKAIFNWRRNKISSGIGEYSFSRPKSVTYVT